jgi:hypothetical protein
VEVNSMNWEIRCMAGRQGWTVYFVYALCLNAD